MSITIFSVGKKHETWIDSGVKQYQNRLRKPFNVDWVLLPHSALEGVSARQDESERIMARVNEQDYVILLDERGKAVDSVYVANVFQDTFTNGRRVIVIIGGAYGVDESVHQRANFVWSLSPLVFPHQLVRLILIEQIYRSQQIIAAHPYHHE